jgi:hypothetical protein
LWKTSNSLLLFFPKYQNYLKKKTLVTNAQNQIRRETHHIEHGDCGTTSSSLVETPRVEINLHPLPLITLEPEMAI